MKLILATISNRKVRIGTGLQATFSEYLKRCGPFTPVEHQVFPTEQALLQFLDKTASRTRPVLFAAESRGEMLTSEGFAEGIGQHRDSGTQLLVVAIGPADGWSDTALKRADRKISFGRITLPHELAAVIAAEQIYRALTILAGHPYHSGH